MRSADVRTALDEIGRAVEGVDDGAIDAALHLIARADRIVGCGCGRERLQLAGFVMRLHHLGLSATMQGDISTPPVGPGDLVIASAGPGELATVTALMERARDAGAGVLFLTAEPETSSVALASEVLAIPAQTMASDRADDSSRILPMGSVFEGAMFLLFEIMVSELKTRLDFDAETMRANHTNLE